MTPPKSFYLTGYGFKETDELVKLKRIAEDWLEKHNRANMTAKGRARFKLGLIKYEAICDILEGRRKKGGGNEGLA